MTRPVPTLRLASASRAGDAGYLAAADLAAVAGSLRVDYRLIGGNAVTLLVAVQRVRAATAGLRLSALATRAASCTSTSGG